MKRTLWFLTGLIVVSCAHSSGDRSPTALDSSGLPFPIFDAHVHFKQPEKTHDQPSQEMLEVLAAAGVHSAVVHFEAGESAFTKVNRKSPVKLFVCAAIVPGETVERVQKGIREGHYQCMKIYLGYVAKWAKDPFYLPFYRLAERENVPVAFHTGDTYSKNVYVKYAEPLQIDDIAVQFPKVKFIIAHLGNPWLDSAAEVVYKNDNVYADVSALMLGDARQKDPAFLEHIVVQPIRWFFLYVDNPKKVMFGSDWPLLDIGAYVEAVKRAIPEKHWKAVFHDNAVEVFGGAK